MTSFVTTTAAIDRPHDRLGHPAERRADPAFLPDPVDKISATSQPSVVSRVALDLRSLHPAKARTAPAVRP